MTTVYLETSILSYLTARPTRDLLATARQQMTREWWDTRRARFDLFVSPLVEQEVRRGAPDAARRRVEALGGLQTLEIVAACESGRTRGSRLRLASSPNLTLAVARRKRQHEGV